MKFLPAAPEVSSILGNLYIVQDLVNHAVTIYLKDWQNWNINTNQVFIAPNLIHFVEPGGSIVGIKVMEGVENESQS